MPCGRQRRLRRLDGLPCGCADSEQRGGGEDLAGLAVAALGHVDLLPRHLDGMEAVGREALDGGDGLAYDGTDVGDARARRLAVQQHGACAADTHAAAVLGAFEVENVAQHPEQRGVLRHIYGHRHVVDLEFESHRTSPGC